MGIQPLDPRNTDDVDAVALLHEEHLGDSPIVLLGGRFLREFYYPRLIEDGLLECVICKADGRVVAFLSWTLFPDGFMMRAIRAHLVRLSWIMTRQLLTTPSSLKGILNAISIVRERSAGQAKAAPGTAEAISLVVLPAYQKHIPPGGKSRLTVRLFEELGVRLRASGAERVTFLVKPENRASNIFLSAIGCRFEKVIEFGVPTHKYTYELNRQAAERSAG